MDPMTQLQGMFDGLGLTELTGLMITITAMSGSFYFILGIIRPPIAKLIALLKQLTYREVSIYVADPEYDKFNQWLDENSKYTRFQRAYKVVNVDHSSSEYGEVAGSSSDDQSDTRSRLVTGYGSVLVKAPGLPYIWVSRTKDEAKQVYALTETLTFRIFSLSPSAVFKFFDQVVGLKGEKGPFVKSAQDHWWREIGKPKKVLDPLGPGALEFIADVEQFLNDADEYKARGIPHKRGYLLYGIPGTGKTSIIAYLSKKFKMDILMLSSTSIAKFDQLIGDINPGSIILIEDIDMTIAGDSNRNAIMKIKEDPSDDLSAEDDSEPEIEAAEIFSSVLIKDSMRDFLNALDGICDFQGSIIVATTNKPNVLDGALLRPGRIDKQIEIEPFTNIEQIQHVNRFFGVEIDPAEYEGTDVRTFAEIQDLCVTNMHDVAGALRAMK